MNRRLCVCGAGTMGSGIAQCAAQAGIETTLFDLDNRILEKARADMEANLEKMVQKNKFTSEEKNEIINRIHFVTDIISCKAAFIIEAIIEKKDVKTALFNQLAAINSQETIFATNTSSLSVSEIQKEVAHPERLAGMHFFNPATIMKLVEVVKGDQTSEKTVNQITELAKRMGKTPVLCKDAPGFIVNHVARPFYLEALRLLEMEAADAETIDALLESNGFRMGPFKLMDLIGNDINYAVSCSVYEQLGKPERLKPSMIQKLKVEKNELGKKTGKGYYNYS